MPEDKKKNPDGKKADKNKGKDKLDRDEIEEEYGLSFALFKAYPELYDLLKKAVNQNWTPTKFQVELRQTKWFEKHSDVWRKNIALMYADPTTFKERLNNNVAFIENLVGQYGVQIGEKGIKRLAERALLFNMDERQVMDYLSKFVRPGQGGTYEGSLAAIEENLRGLAFRNGVGIGKDQLKRWMRNIVRGDATQEQFESHIRNVAAQTFEAYGSEIRSGMDLADVASPYVQIMSDVLEINPASIDMRDRTIRKALTFRNEKGEAVPMSMSAFEDSLRQDRRWQYTDNARTQAMGFADAISKMWGMRA